MQIKTKVTDEKLVDIQLPLFKKKLDGWDYYIAVLNEKTSISITLGERVGYASITHASPSAMDHLIAPALDWQDISEQEFMYVHKQALLSLSLEPVLIDADPNDLKDLNI